MNLKHGVVKVVLAAALATAIVSATGCEKKPDPAKPAAPAAPAKPPEPKK